MQIVPDENEIKPANKMYLATGLTAKLTEK